MLIIPSPSVVFSIEEEVGTDDGHAHCHNAQDHQHQHHESVHIINLIGPERGEDKVPAKRRKQEKLQLLDLSIDHGGKKRTEELKYLHLNKYRPKWQDATQTHNDCRFHEPDKQKKCTHQFRLYLISCILLRQNPISMSNNNN